MNNKPKPQNKFAKPKSRRPDFKSQKPRFKKLDTTSVLSKEDVEYINSLISFQNNQIMVFNKPSGLSVQKGSGIDKDLEYYLEAFKFGKKPKPRLVHRLDRETSGLIMVAKNKVNAAHLSEQFAKRLTEKTYYAIVAGNPAQNIGQINLPLKRIKQNGIDISVICKKEDKDAQEAITDYEVISNYDNAALIKLYPRTGRMHQLRAHMAHIGHPILGDTKYGGLFVINGILVKRLMLHAYSLEISQFEGKKKTFICEIAKDMQELTDKLAA